MRKTVHEVQNKKNGQKDHSGYQIFCQYPWSNMVVLQQKIWLLFLIFICFHQTIYFKENVEKTMKNIWVFYWNYILIFSVFNNWSLMVPSKSMERNKALYKTKSIQTACPCHQPCICRIKTSIQLHLFFPNF